MAIANTELEHCTLAEIRRLQPCSAYAVRQVFARSSTPEWSGSTGSIYPAVERLLRRQLIEVTPETGDRRGRRNLRVTRQGDATVRAWINAIEPRAAKATPDPIRTRASYLNQLASDAERIAFLKHAITLTEAALEELAGTVEALRTAHTDEYLAGRGAIHQIEARRSWLRELTAFYMNSARLDES